MQGNASPDTQTQASHVNKYAGESFSQQDNTQAQVLLLRNMQGQASLEKYI
jgi:hypothetical protein